VILAESPCACREEPDADMSLNAPRTLCEVNACTCQNMTRPRNCKVNADPILTDDGSGSDISIPSFFMFQADADQLRAALEKDIQVQVGLAWSLPTSKYNPDDAQRAVVEYDVWDTPGDESSNLFWLQFQPFVEALGDRAHFTPHMYLHDGLGYHCDRGNGYRGGVEGDCETLCTNNGRYCAPTPMGELGRGSRSSATDVASGGDGNGGTVSGANIVTESLRRLCIWKVYGASSSSTTTSRKVWWDYLNEFISRCQTVDSFTDEECVRQCYQRAGIEERAIVECTSDSGNLTSNNPNTLLDTQLASQIQNGIIVVPTISIHGATLQERLSPSKVFEAICNSYPEETTRPYVCSQCSHCHDIKSCVTPYNGTYTCRPSNDTIATTPTTTAMVDTEKGSSINQGDERTVDATTKAPTTTGIGTADNESSENSNSIVIDAGPSMRNLVWILLFFNTSLVILVVGHYFQTNTTANTTGRMASAYKPIYQSEIELQ
jgi:hypothetical protein